MRFWIVSAISGKFRRVSDGFVVLNSFFERYLPDVSGDYEKFSKV